MAWLNVAWVFVVAVALLFVPGTIFGLALGARRFVLAAFAAPLTLVVIGAVAIANQVLPFRWGWLPLLIGSIVLAAITYLARVLWRRRWADIALPPLNRLMLWASIIGALIAFVIIVSRLIASITDPSNISQTFDNIYHLNAVRFITDTGTASPFEQLIPGFYPDTWHALVAPVVSLTGVSIPISVNMMNIAVAALMWPLGCMMLVRQIFGRRPLVMVLGGVLSAAFAGFPMLMLDYGVLYPDALSLAMLPSVFAAVLMVLRLPASKELSSAAALWLMLSLIPGLALAHPSSLMALLAVSFPPCVIVAYRNFRQLSRERASMRRRTAVIGAWAIGAIAAAVLLLKARPTFAQAFWGPSATFGGSVWSTLTNSPVGKPIAVTITVLMLVGIVAVFVTRSHRWVVATFAVMAGLYVVCASFPRASFRYWLTGTWYSDVERLAALMPIVALPLAVIGAVWIYDCINRALLSSNRQSTDASSQSALRPISAVVAVVLVAVVVVGSQAEPSMQSETAAAKVSYASMVDSPLLSNDERTLLDRLASEVPADAVIVGSPWTGTSFSYAISNRRAMIPHIYAVITPTMNTVVTKLRVADTHPSVCRAIRKEGVKYVLDFGLKEVHGGRHAYPGIENLSTSKSVRLVDHVGDAKLYRVTACW